MLYIVNAIEKSRRETIFEVPLKLTFTDGKFIRRCQNIRQLKVCAHSRIILWTADTR